MNAKRRNGLYKRSLLPMIAAVLLAAAPAQARDVLFLAGAEGGAGGSTSYYNFVGAVAPLLDNGFGNGPMQKYKVDFLGYDYRGGAGNVTATAVGLSGAVGYAKGGEKGWAGAYAGFRYSNTWLSPDDPKSRVRGSQIRPELQLEGERTLSEEWKVSGLASYVFISDSYWSRGRLMYRLYDSVYTGPEVTAQGDPSYRAWSGGWFVTGFSPTPKSSLGVKLGVRKIEKIDPSGYIGIEFAKMF